MSAVVPKSITLVRPAFERVVSAGFLLSFLLLVVSVGLPRGAWGAALTYKQTDTTGITDNFGCDGVTTFGTNRVDLMMQQGGTAGTVSQFISNHTTEADIDISYVSPADDPGLKSWQAGNWVVRLDVDPTNTDGTLTWDGTCIFVVDSAGT